MTGLVMYRVDETKFRHVRCHSHFCTMVAFGCSRSRASAEGIALAEKHAVQVLQKVKHCLYK